MHRGFIAEQNEANYILDVSIFQETGVPAVTLLKAKMSSIIHMGAEWSIRKFPLN